MDRLRYVRIKTSGKYNGMVARWFSTLSEHPWSNILLMDSEGHELCVAKNKTEEISKVEYFKGKLCGKEVPHNRK